MSKTVQDLTIKEVFEDLDYYLNQIQLKSPSFCDSGYDIVRKYVEELKGRIEGLKEEIQSLEDADPLEGYEPMRDESRD